MDENQTTKPHEPGITKWHKESADDSSMLLPSRSGHSHQQSIAGNLLVDVHFKRAAQFLDLG